MRCALIYNPVAGSNRSKRTEQLRQIGDALVARGHIVNLVATTAPGSATRQAAEAIAAGAEIIFACGGDGTVHEVLQALVVEGVNPSVCLGILPLGSANALARHMRLSFDPVTAILQQIEGESVIVPVGRLDCSSGHRYFAVMAGAGPDGTLAYEVPGAHKSRFGRLAYYAHAARLFATRRFGPFQIRYREASSRDIQTARAVSVMGVRVDDLGGLFRGLALRNASLYDPHLKVQFLAPPAAISLPLWFLSGWLGLHRLNPFVQCLEVSEISSYGNDDMHTHVQVDGEWLGRGAMSLSLIPNALQIRIPFTAELSILTDPGTGSGRRAVIG